MRSEILIKAAVRDVENTLICQHTCFMAGLVSSERIRLLFRQDLAVNAKSCLNSNYLFIDRKKSVKTVEI